MRTLHYEILLKQDTSLPSPAGRRTGGASPSLDFVPGSALLGAAARYYDDAAASLRWDLFHCGRVRYGDARLISLDDAIGALPAPLCMYLPKGVESKGWDDTWVNFLCLDDTQRAAVQYVPIRGQVAPDGVIESVDPRYTLRTAVDYVQQRAQEGQLYGMGGLPAGTRLRGSIEMDDGICSAAEKFLVEHLHDRPLFLGQRKSAGLGLATLTFLRSADTQPTRGWQTSDQPVGAAGMVHVWLISEICLVDPDTGAPTLEVDPTHFGLNPEAHHVVRRNTFVRSLRWTSFNRHRRRPDVEHIALKAGSVVTLDGFESAQQVNALRNHVACGIGLFRAEGLGRVIVQPQVLLSKRANLGASRPKADPTKSPPPPLPETGRMGPWLMHRSEVVGQRRTARRLAEDAFNDQFKGRYARSRRDLPGPSQWITVAGVARKAMGARHPSEMLFQELFGGQTWRSHLDAPDNKELAQRAQRGALVRGAAARRWFVNDKRGPGPALRRWLSDLHKDPDVPEATIPLTLGLLADRMAKAIQQAMGGDR